MQAKTSTKSKQKNNFQLTVTGFSMEASVAGALEIFREFGTFSKVLAWIWQASALNWNIKHKINLLGKQELSATFATRSSYCLCWSAFRTI